jgi:hypothetical protein
MFVFLYFPSSSRISTPTRMPILLHLQNSRCSPINTTSSTPYVPHCLSHMESPSYHKAVSFWSPISLEGFHAGVVEPSTSHRKHPVFLLHEVTASTSLLHSSVCKCLLAHIAHSPPRSLLQPRFRHVSYRFFSSLHTLSTIRLPFFYHPSTILLAPPGTWNSRCYAKKLKCLPLIYPRIRRKKPGTTAFNTRMIVSDKPWSL